MTIMTSGMAHVSGGIMAAYIAYGIHASDLLAAVIMTAPGTILVSKMLVPETEVPPPPASSRCPTEEHSNENFMGAIARGTIDGGALAFNVAIMLISFLALVSLANGIFGGIHNYLAPHHIPFPTSLNAVLSFFFAPVAWLIGIPWHEPDSSATCSAPVPSQRAGRLHRPRPEIPNLPTQLHHHNVRPLRLCQSKLHRRSDRRHRSPRPQPPQRPR